MTTLEQILISTIPALCGAVVSLFFWFRAQYAKMEKLLATSEKERGILWRSIAKLERRAGWIRNCPVTACPFAKRLAKEEEADDDEDELDGKGCKL